MGKGKYQEWLTEDSLLIITGWAREGLTNEQIAKNIGVTKDTLYKWMRSYPKISEALSEGRRPLDVEIENALVKKAKGFIEDEVVEEITEDKDGNKIKHKKITHKVFPPDTTAAIFYLKNRAKNRYQDRPKTAEEIKALELDNAIKELKLEEMKQLLSGDNPQIEAVKEMINIVLEDVNK